MISQPSNFTSKVIHSSDRSACALSCTHSSSVHTSRPDTRNEEETASGARESSAELIAAQRSTLRQSKEQKGPPETTASRHRGSSLLRCVLAATYLRHDILWMVVGQRAVVGLGSVARGHAAGQNASYTQTVCLSVLSSSSLCARMRVGPAVVEQQVASGGRSLPNDAVTIPGPLDAL